MANQGPWGGGNSGTWGGNNNTLNYRGRGNGYFKNNRGVNDPLSDAEVNISRNGADAPRLLDCFYQNDKTLRPIEEERERAAAFFAKNACDTPKDAKKPTILIVGDSQAEFPERLVLPQPKD